MKEKIAAIVQARISSTRLPKKAMLKVLNKPLLEHMINQIKRSKKINEIIIATSKKKENNIIRNFCKKKKIKCYSGSETNLVKRYYEAAKKFQVFTIVRLTSDCPLVDPNIIDKCIRKFLTKKYDFVANTSPPYDTTYPDGMDVEIFSFKTLQIVNKLCKNKSYLEHVTPYIWKKKKIFNLYKVKLKQNLSHVRLTVDYLEDFQLVKKIIIYFIRNKIKLSLKNIINFLKKNKKIYFINKTRNKKFKYF